MKKILLILSLLLVANFAYSKTNPDCINTRKICIFQVLDKGALAHTCPRFNFEYSDMETACSMTGRLIYLPNNHNYVDNQIVKLKKNQCFAEGGRYSYYNKDNMKKTVRKVRVINKQL